MLFKASRTRAGKLQKEVAAALGVDRSRYVKWENEKAEPPFEMTLKLAEYYGISVDELLGRVTSYEAGTLAGLQLDERRIITEYRKLNDTGKMKTFEFILMARNTYPADQPGEWQGDPLPCMENQKR